MKRLVLAFVAALTISACSPAGAVDPNNPWAALRPWNHGRADIVKLPSGVEYYVLHKGDGKGVSPGVRDTVEVNYDGRRADNGKQFDASEKHGGPARFQVGGVIPGWTQGLQKMQPGDRFMFWIPSKEAYGERGQGMDIDPNTDLMFTVDLIKVIPDPWTKVSPWPTDAANIVRLPSGLEYFPVDSGPDASKSPTDADEVAVNFEGRLEGVKGEPGESADDLRRRSVVASTFEEGQPKFFPVKDLVPGWSEVLKLMHKGDRWMVRMPSQLLYQADGDGRIPPDATVVYELELLDFAPAGPAAGQPQPGAPIPN